jgi:hypothetical protein
MIDTWDRHMHCLGRPVPRRRFRDRELLRSDVTGRRGHAPVANRERSTLVTSLGRTDFIIYFLKWPAHCPSKRRRSTNAAACRPFDRNRLPPLEATRKAAPPPIHPIDFRIGYPLRFCAVPIVKATYSINHAPTRKPPISFP